MKRRDGVGFERALAIPGELEREDEWRAALPDEQSSSSWERRAERLVASAREALWGVGGAEALAYLRSRGLRYATIREARLGWHPGSLEWPYRGITIPWY